MDNCPSCDTSTGVRHSEHCDVARCSSCGGQRCDCGCVEGNGGIWTGEWPGKAECREYGLYAVLVPYKGWLRAKASDEGAIEDLNSLYAMGQSGVFVWNGVRWIRGRPIEVTDIVRVLGDSLSDEGVRQWLQAPSTYLDGSSPADALLAGQDLRVAEAARAFVEGPYL